MKQKIRVWIKEAGDKRPRHVAISPKLENLQKYVEGFIESFQYATDATIICNEEGRIIGLKPNVEILGNMFYGTIIFVGVNGEEFADFPIQDVKEMKRMFPQLWEES